MKLDRLTLVQNIDIWQPRWKDRTVMVAAYKLGTHNAITFSKSPSMPDTYYIAGSKARTFPKQTNGKVDCYCIPLDELEILERE